MTSTFPARSYRRIRAAVAIGGAIAALLVVAVPTALAVNPAEVSQPTIEGTLRQDHTLSAGNGIWANSPTSFTYQWVRCNASGAQCNNVSGQTASTYFLSGDDVGKTIIVLVTATNSSGSTQANSRTSGIISANVLPAATTVPSITGTAEVGSQLTASTGVWTGGPTLSVQWQRCDAAGKNCGAVTGATGTTYGILQADQGATIVASVTARNDVGSATSPSAASAVVATLNGSTPKDAVKLASGETSVDASSLSLPQRLVLSKFALSPLTIASRSTEVTVRVRVTDTRGYAVSNALVGVTVLPSDRASISAAVRSAADGWATFTLTPRAGLPLKRGAVVNLYVHASKDNDTPLAGVSTARLVSVKVKPA